MPEPPVVGDGEENVRTFGRNARLVGGGEMFKVCLCVSFAEFSKGGGREVNLVALVPEVVRGNEGGALYLVGKIPVGRIHHLLVIAPWSFGKLAHLAC